MKNRNDILCAIVIIAIGLGILGIVMYYNRIKEEKQFQEVKNLELEDPRASIEYESTKGQRHYYDNVSDVDLHNIKVTSENSTVEYNYGDKCLDIKSELQYIMTPESLDKVTNDTDIVLTYTFSDLDKTKAYIVFTSNSIGNKEQVELADRYIDTISIFNIKYISIFDKEQDGTIETFIKTVGNPSYNYTETIKDMYNTEYYVTSYVYDGEHINMIVFSSDDVNIDRISFEIIN